MKAKNISFTIATLAAIFALSACGGSKKQSIRLAPNTTQPANEGTANLDNGNGGTQPESTNVTGTGAGPGADQRLSLDQVGLATLGTRIDSNNETLYSIEAHVIFVQAETGLPNSYAQNSRRLTSILDPLSVAEGPLRNRYTSLNNLETNLNIIPAGAIAAARAQTPAGQHFALDCNTSCFPATINTQLITAATATANVAPQVFEIPSFAGYDTAIAQAAAAGLNDVFFKYIRLVTFRMIVKPVWTSKIVDGEEVRLIGVEIYRAQIVPDASAEEAAATQP